MFEGMSVDRMKAALEALLYVTDDVVDVITLAEVLEADPAEVEQALVELAGDLEARGAGVELKEIAGGWRMFTNSEFGDLLEKYILSWDTRRMSQAALEVLAIVAYGQPITRAQISSVRGVNSDSAINTLMDRGLLRESGVADVPGNPVLYSTSRTFLEKFGLKSAKDLPPLADFAPDEKTAQLIAERLGATENVVLTQAPAAQAGEQLSLDDVVGDALGVVDKIDFSQLKFDTDDE